jgi:hypothetical protein
MSSTQPIIIPESILPQKISEKDIEIQMMKFADEMLIEENEKLRQAVFKWQRRQRETV